MAKILISPSKYIQGAGEMKKLGTYAAERLFELIEMPDRRGDTYIQVLETEMIVRKSCREIKEEG